jgi:hypothetical protein
VFLQIMNTSANSSMPATPGFFTPQRLPQVPSPVSYARSQGPIPLSTQTTYAVEMFASNVAAACEEFTPLSADELKAFFDAVLTQDQGNKQFVAHLLNNPSSAFILAKAYTQSQKVKPAAARCLFPPAAPVLGPVRPQLSLTPAPMPSFSLRPAKVRQWPKKKKAVQEAPKSPPRKKVMLPPKWQPKPVEVPQMVNPFGAGKVFRGAGKGFPLL